MTNAYWPLPVPDALGPLIGADDVAEAVEATIELWSPFYIGAISGRLVDAAKIGGRSQPAAPLKPFGKWRNESEFRTIGTGEPAAYQVRVPATVGDPHLKGNGLYVVTWRAQVSVQFFGTNWREARDGTSWYEKAVRACVLQHRSLGGFANGTFWRGAQYAGIEHSSSRTEGQAVLGFDVEVLSVTDVFRGPKEVPVPALVPEQDPTVETTSVTVTNVRPTGTLEED